jgi:hypothetical protein
MSSFARLPIRRSALIAAVLAGLVLAQWLGTIHRIAHAHAGEAHESAGASVSHSHAAAADEAESVLDALFGHDRGSVCELYDQLTHADALAGVPALALPAIAPVHPARVHRTWHLAAQSAGFLARGPPSLS